MLPIQKLTVVIPVYNEQDTIAQVIERVCSVNIGNLKMEIIISDDGSTDSTPHAIESSRLAHAEIVRVYTSPTNLGKGAAVRLGISLAKGDVIIIQDADLELDPAEYSRILQPFWTGSADVVYGSRFARSPSRVPTRTRWANRFLTTLTNLLFHCHLTDMETAYKAFRREAVADLRLRCVRFDFEPEITAKLLKAGYRIHEVPISYHPRTAHEGKKVSFVDGIDAILTLFRCRFFEPD